jgi:hypothetical protein
MRMTDDQKEMLLAALVKLSEGGELTRKDLSCCRSSSLTR